MIPVRDSHQTRTEPDRPATAVALGASHLPRTVGTMTVVASAGFLLVAAVAVWVAFRILRFLAALATAVVVIVVGIWLIPGGAVDSLVEQFPTSGDTSNGSTRSP